MLRFFVLLPLALALALAGAAEIQIAPVEGFNLEITGRPSPTAIEVKPNPRVHNWFAARLINLPVGQVVTIHVNMTGCDTPGNVADTAKWLGLRPLYTYADPEQYAAYEWFRLDGRGQWVSGDPFKSAAARPAGTGRVPAQSAISAALAEEFLSEDGAFWSPWQEADEGEANRDTRTFIFTIHPEAPTMTVAMHVPYLLAYERELVARLKAARLPGVFIDELGRSGEGRPLYMIRVDDPGQPAVLQIEPPATPNLYVRQWDTYTLTVTDSMPLVRMATLPSRGERRVMFLDAREHPSEHAGSWAVLGALKALLADTPEAARLRRGTTWLLLPVYDPDGVAAAQFDPRTERFRFYKDSANTPRSSTPEVLAYSAYLRVFANAGWLFASSTTFYGFECNEGRPLVSVFAAGNDRDRATAFNRCWFPRLQAAGLPTGPETPQFTGWLPFRLATGNTGRYRAFGQAYQINDRYPECRLTLEGLERLGGDYARAMIDWIATPEGAQAMDALRAAQQARLTDNALRIFSDGSYQQDKPTLFELLVAGY